MSGLKFFGMSGKIFGITEKFLYVGKMFLCSDKNFATPPRSPPNFGEKILISDGNVVGKSDTTPPSFFILFAMALLITCWNG